MHRRQSVALLLSAFCLNGKEVNAQGVNKGAVKVGSQRKTQASKSACQEMRGERHQFTGAQLGGDGKAGQRELQDAWAGAELHPATRTPCVGLSQRPG